MLTNNLLFLVYSIFLQCLVLLFTGVPLFSYLSGVALFFIFSLFKLQDYQNPKRKSFLLFISIVISTLMMVFMKVITPNAIFYMLLYGILLSVVLYFLTKNKNSEKILDEKRFTYIPDTLQGKISSFLFIVSLTSPFHKSFGTPTLLSGLVFLFLVKGWNKKEKAVGFGLWLLMAFVLIVKNLQLIS